MEWSVSENQVNRSGAGAGLEKNWVELSVVVRV